MKNLLCFSNCADYASSVNVRFLQFKIYDFSNLCFPLSSTNEANFITCSALLFENGINKIYWNVVMGTRIGILLCTRCTLFYVSCFVSLENLCFRNDGTTLTKIVSFRVYAVLEMWR